MYIYKYMYNVFLSSLVFMID